MRALVASLRAFDGYTLYTTFEPCLMCASAIILCQIPNVRYAADDPVWDGMHDWFRTLPFARSRLPERECLGGPIGAFAHVLHLSWIALWFPEGDRSSSTARSRPKHSRSRSDLVQSSDLRSIAADRGNVTAAIDALVARPLDLPRSSNTRRRHSRVINRRASTARRRTGGSAPLIRLKDPRVPERTEPGTVYAPRPTGGSCDLEAVREGRRAASRRC